MPIQRDTKGLQPPNRQPHPNLGPSNREPFGSHYAERSGVAKNSLNLLTASAYHMVGQGDMADLAAPNLASVVSIARTRTSLAPWFKNPERAAKCHDSHSPPQTETGWIVDVDGVQLVS
jgi:hypothetical protein